jgi:hypothetical protein
LVGGGRRFPPTSERERERKAAVAHGDKVT